MNKPIGLFLIITGMMALLAGAYIDSNYGTNTLTGNSIKNVIDQPSPLNKFDYLGALSISYAIIGFTAGFVFLFRFGK